MIPEITRRIVRTRGTPRTLSGSSGRSRSICVSLSQNRFSDMATPIRVAAVNHEQAGAARQLMGPEPSRPRCGSRWLRASPNPGSRTSVNSGRFTSAAVRSIVPNSQSRARISGSKGVLERFGGEAPADHSRCLSEGRAGSLEFRPADGPDRSRPQPCGPGPPHSAAVFDRWPNMPGSDDPLRSALLSRREPSSRTPIRPAAAARWAGDPSLPARGTGRTWARMYRRRNRPGRDRECPNQRLYAPLGSGVAIVRRPLHLPRIEGSTAGRKQARTDAKLVRSTMITWGSTGNPAVAPSAGGSGSAVAPFYHAGGGGGIRTHETVSRLPVFKTGAFDRSATPPSRTGIDRGLGLGKCAAREVSRHRHVRTLGAAA